MAPTRVLITGLDAESAGRNKPGIDGPTLKKELDESLEVIRAQGGVDLDECWLYLEDTNPAERLKEKLRSEKAYDGILVGWGVRGSPQYSGLFEDCLEVMKRFAPVETKFLFSTTTHDHLETIRRTFPE